MENIEDVCYICGADKNDLILSNGIDYEYGIKGDFTYYKCTKCGLIRMLPRPNAENVTDYYPDDYHSYKRPSFFIFRILSNINLSKRIKRYKQLIGNAGNVLDVGCGDGEIMEALKFRGDYDCYGIELKKEIVELGVKKGLKIFYGTLENIDLFKDDYFDLIIMNHLIEHLEDPYSALIKAYRYLKKGGWLCGETPNMDCIESGIFKDKWAGYHVPRHLQVFDFFNLYKLFKKTGFSMIILKKSYNPGQWALSMQNLFLSKFKKVKLINGKSWVYPFFLFLSLPIVLIEILFSNKTGILYFEIKK